MEQDAAEPLSLQSPGFTGADLARHRSDHAAVLTSQLSHSKAKHVRETEWRGGWVGGVGFGRVVWSYMQVNMVGQFVGPLVVVQVKAVNHDHDALHAHHPIWIQAQLGMGVRTWAPGS